MSATIIQILKVGALYFAAVFAVGFVLGAIRTLWVEPELGTRVAELIEAPMMLLVVVFAARTSSDVMSNYSTGGIGLP